MTLTGMLIGVILIAISEIVMSIIAARRRIKFHKELEKMIKEFKEQK